MFFWLSQISVLSIWNSLNFSIKKRKIYFPVKVTLAVLGATAHAEEKEFLRDSEKVLPQIKINFVSSSHYNLNLCLNSYFCSFFFTTAQILLLRLQIYILRRSSIKTPLCQTASEGLQQKKFDNYRLM